MMDHPSRVPHAFCSVWELGSSLGNLGQGGKTGETKAPIAKMATDGCIVFSFVCMYESGGLAL